MCVCLSLIQLVIDWDAAPELWRYALKDALHSNPSEHPLIMTEAPWNPPPSREKTLEVAFENLDVPAFYLAKTAVCVA